MFYLFDKNDKFIKTFINFIDSNYKRTLNNEWTFKFECPLTNDFVKGNKIGFYDKQNKFRYFVINDVEDDFEIETTTVNCIVEYLTLANTTIEDKRVVNGSCRQAFEKVLEGTNFQVGNIEPFGNKDINFYFQDRYSSIVSIVKAWGGELDYNVTINSENVIVSKVLDLVHSIGNETGLRCTYDTNLRSLKRKIHSDNHFNVLYGRGSSLETENGGHSRKLTFDGITWSKPINPLDKPTSYKFLEHPESIEKWGRLEGIYENDKIEDKNLLLESTYEALIQCIEPKISYETSVEDIRNIKGFEHYDYSLGDTIHIINEDKDIIITARITEEEYPLTEYGEVLLKLGDTWETLTSAEDNTEDNLKDYIDNIVGDIDINIDDSKFPNTLPNVPTLIGKGGLNTISISWTYEAKNYYSYEVYASKTKDFEPHPSDKIFEGQASHLIHECLPKETWYFKARAKNTHNQYTSFSEQLKVDTTVISDGTVWIGEGAIGDLLVGTLRLDRGWIGQLDADLLNVKGKLQVIDGNGEITLSVDSFGRITMNVSELSIASKSVSTEEYVDAAKTEAITNAINQAKTYTDTNIQSVNTEITSLENTMNTTFKDGVISESEAITIKERIVSLETSKTNIDKQYSTLYANENLLGTYKTNLKTAYDTYVSTHDTLISAINTSVSDNKITTIEKEDIDIKTNELKTALATYMQRENEGIDSIAKVYSNDAVNTSKTYTDTQIKVEKGNILFEVEKVQENLGNLTVDVEGKLVTISEIINNTTDENLETTKKILEEALKDYITTGEYNELLTIMNTKFEQTSESFDFTFNELRTEFYESIEGIQIESSELHKYIRFEDGNILIGNSASKLTLVIKNDRIQFLESGTEVAYINNNKLYITDAEITNSLKIGKFIWKPRSNGNLSFVWEG